MATDSPLTGAISNNFIISAPAAAKLGFAQQPTYTLNGAAVSPAVTVAVQDASGNTIATNNSTVTLTLSGGTFASGGNTATVAAVNGIGTFNNLIINATGTYTLTASDGALTSATSGSFVICPLGDVNLDGAINATDIDQLYAYLGDTTGRYDLNGDGVANQGDVDYLVKTILQTGYADANLNGKVDFEDFQVLLDHWQSKAQGWAGGDWNGDGVTDFQDFQMLLDNWNPNGFGAASQSDMTSMSSAAVSAAAAVQVASSTVASPLADLPATTAAAVSTASASVPAPLDTSIDLPSQGVTVASAPMQATRLISSRSTVRQLRHSAVFVQNDNADTVDLLTQLIKPVVA
jgi:hypothetical protein